MLAVTLVLLATVVSVLRYTLPHADNYKHRLEQLITSQYGASVRIGELNAAWQKSGPALVLKDVVLGSEQEELQLHIAETRVLLDFWRSLFNLQLKAEHFELSGLTYYLDSDRLISGGLSAEGTAEPILTALEQLFFHQLKYFSVLDSRLVLQSEHDPDLIIRIKELDWRNDNNRHQGFGQLSIDEVTANNLSFVLDLHGSHLNETSGQLYLESEQLDVLPLFRKLLPQIQRLDQASINFRGWGQIDNGALKHIQIELAENSLYWRRDGQHYQLQLGDGQLLWLPQDDGWSLYSGMLTLTDQKQQWPELQFQLHHHQQQWQGSLQNFKLEALTPLAHLLAEDVEQLRTWLAYQVSGHLQHLNWLVDNSGWYASGKLTALSSAPVRDIPGVQQMQGHVLLSDTFSQLTLFSENSELLWDGLFAEPMAYHKLAATAWLLRSGAEWQLQVPQVQLEGQDISLDASLALDEKQQLSILAKLQQADVATASRYFPQRYMPYEVRQYLQQALLSGELQHATMLWHGRPADFPYSEHQGVFQVNAAVQNSSFEFAPDWPLLTELQLQLLFENASMVLQSEQGTLAGLSLQQGVRAEIPDLFHADKLSIDINRQLEAGQVQQLMAQSPLARSLGATLEHLGVSGLVDGQVKLDISLHSPDVRATGDVQFKHLGLAIAAPEMFVSGVRGSLQFDNDKIRAENLTLNWRNLPVNASLEGANNGQVYQVRVQLSGEHQASELLQSLYPEGAGLAEGVVSWQLPLQLSLPATGFSYQADLVADLQQVELKLPAPYQKNSDIAAKVFAGMTGNQQQAHLAVNYAGQAYFHGELQNSAETLFSRMHLTLGKDDHGMPVPGFGISVELDQLDFLPWLELIDKQLAAIPQGDGNTAIPPLQHVRGKIKQLDVAPGITLNNTVFEVEQQPELWQLQLNGNEIASRWQFFKDWQHQGIKAVLDYLHLPVPVEPQADVPPAVASVSWLTQLPPLDLRCADCTIGSYRLGEVIATAHSTADSWQLTSLQARYKRNELNFSGQWQQESGSRFSGKFFSPNVGAMLNEYQLTSAISGSRADVEFSLNWPGAPQQFALAELGGKVSFNLGEGSLTEVSDQGARLFSIFSLDSLVRKLRLDFRDVFSKGFFYNRMSGNLTLEHGVAQTSDATIDGVPGNMSIQGYADLAARKMDYQMSFAPKVTSSLPVIIAWMVNPATGLAALALDEVFQSAEVISRINFTVTGDFDKPVVTEVNRHSKEVPVPVRVAQPEPVINEEQKPHG